MKAAFCGFGAVSALGSGVEPLSRALAANQSALRPCPSFEGYRYQSTVAGWVPAEVMSRLEAAAPETKNGRAFLLAQEALRQCRASAKTLLADVPPQRKGLVLSTTKAGIDALERRFRGEPCSADAIRHVQGHLLAAELATEAGTAGPVQCVSVACISGLLAIQQGASLIQRGQADAVFVVGVDIVSHFVLAGFTSLKSLDPEGCRPFDRQRVGLSLGESGACVLLTRPDIAPQDAPVVTGWGTSNDANHLTGPSRDGSGLTAAMTRALKMAGHESSAIDYVHLHGTGTPYNDAMESLAMRRVFPDQAPPFSSSKGMLGHTLGAAGVLETILCLLSMRDRRLPGTPRLDTPDSVVPPTVVLAPRTTDKLERVLKVNCGFGGTNSAVVLERRSAE